MRRRGRPTVNGLRSSVSSRETPGEIIVLPALGGPEQRLFEAAPE